MNTERFTDLASQMMRSALDSWRGGNRLFAVLHAGMGSEFCLKAVLCHHDPLLIAAHGDQALRFHTLGFGGEKGVKPLEQARTIGMAEAFKDAEIVMQGRMPVTFEVFRPVMEARNGIAHLAHHNPATAEQVVSTALRLAEAIRKELSASDADFWKGYAHAFHDLKKVAAMPAILKIGLEQAAEDLAQAEAVEAARAAADAAKGTAKTATDALARIPLWDDALGGNDIVVRHALSIARRSAVSAALHTTAMRGQRVAAALLSSYGYVPGDSNGQVAASDAVAVKCLVARYVESAFRVALPSDLKFALSEPSSDVVWRPQSYESARYGTYLWRWEPCPACPAWGDLYGHLEHDVCVDEECRAGGSYCGEHDEGPPTVAHAQTFTCPVCCLVLDAEEELEAAYMERATRYEG
ncbi:hypothetical protein [Streptomyces siamensis]|uniref:hypothetical protein n=1 Tax=Streptomyces siamensis TaxID=1274986 RepID=UPI0031EBB6AF